MLFLFNLCGGRRECICVDNYINGRPRVNWHAPHTQYYCTALSLAARDGHADCVRVLVEAGADAEIENMVRLVMCTAQRPIAYTSGIFKFLRCQTNLIEYSTPFARCVCGGVVFVVFARLAHGRLNIGVAALAEWIQCAYGCRRQRSH